jgi:uncharacterized protein (UPF0261 family)
MTRKEETDMGKTVAVLATLDTKGREAQYLREQIEGLGHRALLIDTGVTGAPTIAADITREEVAEAGGRSLAELCEHPDRAVAAPTMAEGATQILTRLVDAGEVHGVLGLGGTQGTTLSTHAMRALPYGLPKVMVSTMASGDVSPWVDIKDITMMFSVADILGLNPLTRKVLANAAGAVCGMAAVEVELRTGERPLVAVTTVGITTVGAMRAIEVLEDAGYETITFHAVGSGGRAMEQLMREGLIGGVLDYATLEVTNQLHGALLAADDDRLTTAGRLGLPQVLCPGAIEVLVYGTPDTVPERFRDRTLIPHSPQITDVRLDRDEMVALAEEVAGRLAHTKDEAVFLMPMRGFDSYAVAGEGFHDPEADAAFVDRLEELLPPNVRVERRETHIDDPAFATEAAQTLVELMKARG